MMITCPECDREVWLRDDAPPDTPCPHCGHRLGIANIDWTTVEMPLPWELTSATAIDLTAMVPSVAALDRVGGALARQLSVFPVELKAQKLVLAVATNTTSDEMDRIRFFLNCEIEPVLTSSDSIQFAINLWYQ